MPKHVTQRVEELKDRARQIAAHLAELQAKIHALDHSLHNEGTPLPSPPKPRPAPARRKL